MALAGKYPPMVISYILQRILFPLLFITIYPIIYLRIIHVVIRLTINLILLPLVFNLTFFNEVTRWNEMKHFTACTRMSLTIVGRPVIREHHLIQKLPHYFDETTSSRPDLSQSVTPVTSSLAKASSVCAQPCTTCTVAPTKSGFRSQLKVLSSVHRSKYVRALYGSQLLELTS